ncbi:MAG: glycosyltransferase family 2 protein [Flavobacteriales bacterium]
MKVSIITVCFNSIATLEDTIHSVLGQSYSNIEYIIIDGASKDGTLGVLNRFADRIKFVSEPDKGLYDAMNKGIAMATGDLIGILNADDIYQDEQVISNIVKSLNDSDAIYGDLVYVDFNDTSKIIRYWKSGVYKENVFKKGWMPPHPTFFVKRKVYQKYGTFNISLRTSADYEIMLRFIHKHKIKLSYYPNIITRMRTGGQSNASLKNRIKANKEDRLAWKLNGLKPGIFTLYAKPLRKLGQFLKKK